MARKVEVTTICDITAEPGAVPVEFGLHGKHYTIDLAPGPLQVLQNALAGFVELATEVKPTTKHRPSTPRGGTGPAKVDREQNAAIRDWARRNGYEVSDRGRLSVEIVEKYHANAGQGQLQHHEAPEPAPVG